MKLIMLFLVMCGVLTSCAGMKSVNSSFIAENSNKKSVLIVYGNKSDAGSYYKFGAQGLLDFAINNAFGKSVNQAMSVLKATEMTKKYALPKLEQKLGARIGYTNKVYDQSDFEELEDAPKGSFGYDLKKVFGSEYDYAYLLKPMRYGANREYFSIIPKGSPRGAAELGLVLVDLKTNQVIAFQGSAERVEVEGEWKIKPNYPNLVEAGKQAFKLNSELVINKLFAK